MAPCAHAEPVHEESAPADRVIIVRLWWEQQGAGDVAMRARVTSAVNGTVGSSSAASTTDGILDAVRRRVGPVPDWPAGRRGGARG